ncbi:MAG TPA: LysR substrate-binding domain-containing protein [Actinomycetota bacterium]|nr:LysR substrate-binding domain-containing protein [Actinomycetota bacterium]
MEAFLEVARVRSVSRAADALFVTQPAITARIKGLERALDATLFVRTSRGMKLTESGEAFLPYAKRALETLADGRRAVNTVERGGGGRLSVGAAPAVSTYVLPSVLKRFAESHPRISVSVRTGHSEEIVELVLREQVDVGLVRALRHPEIATTPLYEDRLVLVVEPSHRFASSGSIDLEQMSREQLVLFDRTSSYHEVTSAFFRRAGVVPAAVMELDNIEAAKKMVEEGFGVALLPHTAVESADAEPVGRQIVAIRRKDRSAELGAVASFLTTAEQTAPEIAREPPRPGGASPRAELRGRQSRARAHARAR